MARKTRALPRIHRIVVYVITTALFRHTHKSNTFVTRNHAGGATTPFCAMLRDAPQP